MSEPAIKAEADGTGCLIFMGMILAIVGATWVWGGMGLFVGGLVMIATVLILVAL